MIATKHGRDTKLWNFMRILKIVEVKSKMTYETSSANTMNTNFQTRIIAEEMEGNLGYVCFG